jgi:hypothetical protein
MNLARRQAVRAIREFLNALAKELHVLADAEAATLKRPSGKRGDIPKRLNQAANIISDTAANLNKLLK